MVLPKCRLKGIQRVGRGTSRCQYGTALIPHPSKLRNMALVAHIGPFQTILTRITFLLQNTIRFR